MPLYLVKYQYGEKWPGIITNMRQYNPQESAEIPEFLHVFDDKLMRNILTKAGFKIEELTLFDYSNNSSDNQGYLGFIAVNP